MPLAGVLRKNQVGLANISLRKESSLSPRPSCPLVRAWLMGLCPESEIMGCSEPSTWPAGPLSHLSVSRTEIERTRAWNTAVGRVTQHSLILTVYVGWGPTTTCVGRRGAQETGTLPRGLLSIRTNVPCDLSPGTAQNIMVKNVNPGE